jgi:hypothetical protein
MYVVIISIEIANMKLIHPERKAPIAAPKTATTRYEPISHQRFDNLVVTAVKVRLAFTSDWAWINLFVVFCNEASAPASVGKFTLMLLVVIPHTGHGPVCSVARRCPLLQWTARPSDIDARYSA